NNDMIKIFKEGGIELSKEEVLKVLTKTPESEGDDMDSVLDASENADHIRVDNRMLESFLNGLIVFKRGRQEPKPGQPAAPPMSNEPANNLLLKKVKIALQLTSEDMLELLALAGVTVSKS